jgi:hypothetical protein
VTPATNQGQVFYGRHFEPGVASYIVNGKTSVVFIGEEAAKKMDPSMGGKVVTVDHVEGEVPATSDGVKQLADGYVSESFYLPVDGAHWCKFIAVTDLAKRRIAEGWKLSNCYKATEFGPAGKWHAVQYEKEILNGEYDHLAIVQHPRYESSVILTSEEFKKYCNDKKAEITRLANSADKPKPKGEKTVLNIFKRTKVENSDGINFDEMMVRLPKSGVELTLTELVSRQDKFENGEGFANPDHLVKVGNDEMSVKEMCKNYGTMKASMDEEEEKKKNAKKKNDDDAKAEEDKKKNMSEEEKAAMEKKKNDDAKAEEEKKKNEAKAEEEKKKNEAKAAEEKKQNEIEFERFKNKSDCTIPVSDSDSRVVLPGAGCKKGLAAYG